MFYRIGIYRNELYKCKVADRCPACGQMSEMKYVVSQDCFVLGLPVFPTQKTAEAKCFSCQTIIPIFSAPPFVFQRHEMEFHKIKTPLRAYTFLIVMAIGFFLFLANTPIDEWKYFFSE